MSGEAGGVPVRGVVLAAGKGSRMKSDLPKVLHEIHGKPMIHYSLALMEELGVEETVLVAGYKHELIEDRLKEKVGKVRFAIQREQKGTGHALMQTAPFFNGYEGHVFVTYGDMPLLKPHCLHALRRAALDSRSAGAILTITMPNPPEWGRIVRDRGGRVRRIVEVRDASPEILAINEVNVGAYFFHAPPLFDALTKIRCDNAQHEYYLTDVVEVLTGEGHEVSTASVANLDEVFGINQPFQLEYAEKLSDIEFAEGLYQLIDAVATMRKKG